MVEAGEPSKGCCANGGGGGAQPAAGSNHTSTSKRESKGNELPQSTTSDVNTAKIIFMGDARVGKTSIIKAFIDEELQRDKRPKRTQVISDFSKLMTVKNDDGTSTTL